MYFSLMLMYNNSMGIVFEEERRGFTIIEVMLFLALSGFLLIGILAGTGSSIANQRYKDAVQDAVDVLRSAYSFVADTQVQTRDSRDGVCGATIDGDSHVTADKNSGRGRTTCAVYGAVVMISGSRIQTTTLIGLDYHDYIRDIDSYNNVDTSKLTDAQRTILNPSSSDISVLRALEVNNIAKQCNTAGSCNISTVGNMSTRDLKWGAIFKKPNTGNPTQNNSDLKMTLLIYRSPRTGAIRTISMDDVIMNGSVPVDYSTANFTNLNSLGIYSKLNDSTFKQKDLYFCVESSSAESYADHNRVIKIVKNAHSQSGVVLLDMDADEGVSCDG